MRAKQTLMPNVQAAYVVWGMLWTDVKFALQNGITLEVEIRKPKRTTAQNKRMWAMLGEISAQVDWHGHKLSDEDWKHVFSSSLKKQRAVPGIDGGFVVLGTKTSEMTTEEMSELMECMQAFGAAHNVEFTELEGVA